MHFKYKDIILLLDMVIILCERFWNSSTKGTLFFGPLKKPKEEEMWANKDNISSNHV